MVPCTYLSTHGFDRVDKGSHVATQPIVSSPHWYICHVVGCSTQHVVDVPITGIWTGISLGL